MTRRAPAKINLYLRVLKKGPDGKHSVETILQTIALYDTIIFVSRTDSRITVSCRPPLKDTPAQDNLCFKAACLLRSAVSRKNPGVSISITKNIPAGAGFGGGSSDAAATLVGLNKFWGLKLKRRKLISIAEQLGSDVPFFFYCGTAIGTGAGENIRKIAGFPGIWVVLAVPPYNLSTQRVYDTLDHLRASKRLTRTKKSTTILVALRALKNSSGRILRNDLRPACLEICPAVARLERELGKTSNIGAGITGSGPGCFALFPDRETADAARREIASKFPGIWTRTVHTL